MELSIQHSINVKRNIMKYNSSNNNNSQPTTIQPRKYNPKTDLKKKKQTTTKTFATTPTQ